MDISEAGSFKWEGGQPNDDKTNWLCPNCGQRPPANATIVRGEKNYCLYCGEFLPFVPI